MDPVTSPLRVSKRDDPRWLRSVSGLCFPPPSYGNDHPMDVFLRRDVLVEVLVGEDGGDSVEIGEEVFEETEPVGIGVSTVVDEPE